MIREHVVKTKQTLVRKAAGFADAAIALQIVMEYSTRMTVEEYLEKSRDPNWHGDQDENGVDLSIRREN